MPQPLHLGVLQQLLDDVTPHWCEHNLPSSDLEVAPTLMSALMRATGHLEADLHLCVKWSLMSDSRKVQGALQTWLQQTSLTKARYLATVSNLGSALDGLFLWLIAQCLGIHLNLIHANGIWTMRRSTIPDLWDPVIVFALGYFMAMPEVGVPDPDTDKKVDSLEVDLHFGDLWQVLDNFVPSPPKLNRPVQDLSACCDEVGLVPFGEPTCIQDLLADLVPLPQSEYQQSFVTWLRHCAVHLPPVFNWLSSCGLTVDKYCQHLLEDGISDGLKGWLLYLAANVQINILQEDHVWGSS